MSERVTRTHLTARNRDALLAAARRVFLDRGFQGASLEAIAVEAGFSKGVVYSQFDSKADLFLALLEQRREERAASNAELARSRSGVAGLVDLLQHWDSGETGERAWTLLVLEFRIHAARDANVAARYAELHRRTTDGLASVLEMLFRNEDVGPPLPPRTLASVLLALAAGVAVERATDREALPVDVVARILDRLFSAPPQVPATSAGKGEHRR